MPKKQVIKLEVNPVVRISREAYYRMFAYAQAAKGEVTGFGTVDTSAGIYVSDVYIIPQRATGAGCHIRGEDLQAFMQQCAKLGKPERVTQAHLWWHSHSDFGVFRSGTDNGTIDLLLQVMPYVLCIVVNRRNEMEVSLHLKNPDRITIQNVPVVVEDFDAEQVDAEIKAEVEELVKPFEYKPIPEPAKPTSPMMIGYGEYARPFVPEESGRAPFEESRARAVFNKPAPPTRDLWDRYGDQKPLDHKSVFEMSEDEWQKFEASEYPIDWARGNAEETQETKELSPHQRDHKQESDEADRDTKRYIVEEGIIRPDTKGGP